MKLFNQTNKPLRWDMSGRVFECEPYGEISVPDRLVEAVRSRKLPLKASKVPPKVQARAKADEEIARAQGSEVLKLRERAETAEAGLETATKQLEEAQAEGAKLSEALSEMTERAEAAEQQALAAMEQAEALEKQLAELAPQKAEEQRQSRGRASPRARARTRERRVPGRSRPGRRRPGGSRRSGLAA